MSSRDRGGAGEVLSRSPRVYRLGRLHHLLGYAPTTWGEAVAIEEVPGEEMDASSGRLVITVAHRLGLGSGRLSVGLGLGLCVAWAICVLVMATFRSVDRPLAS